MIKKCFVGLYVINENFRLIVFFWGVLQYFSKNDLFMEYVYQYDCDKIVICIFFCDLKNISNFWEIKRYFQEIMKYFFEI